MSPLSSIVWDSFVLRWGIVVKTEVLNFDNKDILLLKMRTVHDSTITLLTVTIYFQAKNNSENPKIYRKMIVNKLVIRERIKVCPQQSL